MINQLKKEMSMAKKRLDENREVIDKMESYLNGDDDLPDEKELDKILEDFEIWLRGSSKRRGRDLSIMEAAAEWNKEDDETRKKKILEFMEEHIDTIHSEKDKKS